MVVISAFIVALATDTPTLAIVLGFAGTVVTGITGAFVAVNLNKNEKKQSAETVLEKALRERIVLRDEKIRELTDDLNERTNERDQAIEERDQALRQRDQLYLVIAKHRGEEDEEQTDGDS